MHDVEEAARYLRDHPGAGGDGEAMPWRARRTLEAGVFIVTRTPTTRRCGGSSSSRYGEDWIELLREMAQTDRTVGGADGDARRHHRARGREPWELQQGDRGFGGRPCRIVHVAGV
jgi:hypothetical protein